MGNMSTHETTLHQAMSVECCLVLIVTHLLSL